MKKFIYVLFVAFLFASCGESHHQVIGSVDYCFDGDTVTYTVPFQKDYYFNKYCKDQGFKPIVSVSENDSELDLYIIGATYTDFRGYYGPYTIVKAPGRKIVYTNVKYKYTVKIN